MRKGYLAFLCLWLLAFIFSGCGVPQEEYDAVAAELDSAREEIKNLKAELATPEREKIENLEAELESLSASLAQIQGSNAALQEKVRELENKLSTPVTLAYLFASRGEGYEFAINIPVKDYLYYREKSRPSWAESRIKSNHPYFLFAQYTSMATDPNDDHLVDSVVRQLNEAAIGEDLNDHDKIALVLAFVQSVTYTGDNVTASVDEYPRYPVETLFDREGDCEDTSILLAAILTEMGYDVALLLFEEFDHIGLGINYPLEYGNSWIYEGKRYWYLDTTGGRSIGWCPDEYAQTSAYVYPVK